jgi:hypothetical protein
MFQNKVLVFIASVTVLLVSLTGCTSPHTDQQKIVGSWKRMNYDLDQIWTFRENGTIDIDTNDLAIYYGFEEGHLWMYFADPNFFDTFEYTFEGDNVLKLHLTDNDPILNQTGGTAVEDNSSFLDFLFHRVS